MKTIIAILLLPLLLASCANTASENSDKESDEEVKYIDTTPPEVTQIYIRNITESDPFGIGLDPLYDPDGGLIRDINGYIRIDAEVKDVDDMAYGFDTEYSCEIKVSENTYTAPPYGASCYVDLSDMGGKNLEGRIIAIARVGNDPNNTYTVKDFSYEIDRNDPPVVAAENDFDGDIRMGCSNNDCSGKTLITPDYIDPEGDDITKKIYQDGIEIGTGDQFDISVLTVPEGEIYTDFYFTVKAVDEFGKESEVSAPIKVRVCKYSYSVTNDSCGT